MVSFLLYFFLNSQTYPVALVLSLRLLSRDPPIWFLTLQDSTWGCLNVLGWRKLCSEAEQRSGAEMRGGRLSSGLKIWGDTAAVSLDVDKDGSLKGEMTKSR